MEHHELTLLHKKVDRLTALLEAQQRRQEGFDELQRELVPIGNHLVRLLIEELADVGGEFEAEDIVYLTKYLLRNTCTLIRLLKQMESALVFFEEMGLLVKPMFNNAVESLDAMERKGYFTFARHGQRMAERIVTEFDEDDLEALGDNIVSILTTVKNMTQPDIMALANTAVDTLRDDDLDNHNVSTWGLLRELRDPQVRRGMVRLLHVVRSLAEAPAPSTGNGG